MLMAISSKIPSSSSSHFFYFQTQRTSQPRIRAGFLNSSVIPRAFHRHQSVKGFNSVKHQAKSVCPPNLHRCQSTIESLICYYKSIPEETIEKQIDLSVNVRERGSNPPCIACEAKGAILCDTCSGSGLYVDPILESQGVVVKVRCLGCGGNGSILCSSCGGRGYAKLD